MLRRLLLILVVTVALTVCTEGFAVEHHPLLVAQDHNIDRGPGGYLSWIKLLLVTICFLIWVRLTDWVNRDSQKIGKYLDQSPETWNPIALLSFLLGFWCVVSIPTFFAGFPIYLLCAFAPFTAYFLIRRGKFLETPTLVDRLKDGPDTVETLPQDEGVEIKFTPAGSSGEDRQKNLIRARRAAAFFDMKSLIADGAKQRAEVIMLDYTRDQVNGQIMIDGAWHPVPAMTREMGDSVLVALKNLAGLNEVDRRSRQQGQFNAGLDGKKLTLDLMTQGTKTGERAQLKFVEKRKSDFTLNQLGMWPEMIERLSNYTAKPGIVLISAPPRQGLTTSWRAVLGASDRITRDWIAVVDAGMSYETDVENIAIHTFEPGGEAPESKLRKLLLSQPDALVVPDIANSDLIDMLIEQANTQDRTVVTRNQAKSAAEALVRLYALSQDKRNFVQAIQCVVGQRLARRLCDKCKVPVRVKPELIQKLGGDPRKINTLYNPYKLPPVEQRVDENGKPIEMLPCKVCGGIGYIGRISIYELINVSSEIKDSLLKKPSVDRVRNLATKAGDLPMLQQGFRLALMGITSVSEVQRVMKD